MTVTRKILNNVKSNNSLNDYYILCSTSYKFHDVKQ